MEFTHGEIAKNGEDRGARGMGQEREAFSSWQRIPQGASVQYTAAGRLFLL